MKHTLFLIRKYFSTLIIRKIFVHWFNPLYTIYFNFIFFPFKQAIKFPVFVYGWPRLYAQYGKMKCVGICKMGMIHINCTIPGGPQYAVGNTELNIWGKIIFKGKCEIGTGNRINIGNYGVLEMGAQTKITNFCNITVYSNVCIGSYSRITHRCQVLDTNFHYIINCNKKIVKRIMSPIEIGNYCWICNSTTITGGTIIPNRTIVASNSLVNKNYSQIPEDSIIGGIPAKLISTGYRRIENKKLHQMVDDFFNQNKNALELILSDTFDKDFCNAEQD